MSKLIVEMEEGRRAEFLMDDDFVCEQHRDVLTRDEKEMKVGPPKVRAEGKFTNMISSDVIWQNECCLVFTDLGGTIGEVGEMGLCHSGDGLSENREVQVRIMENGPQELLSYLKGKPVRITIEVLPEGSR